MGNDSLAAQLRQRGLRLTPQRQLVLDTVAELKHSTPEQIAETIKTTAPGVNITTVYRALELLEKLGLVRHTHLGHGAPTYHAAANADHVHTVCHQCGAVHSLPASVMSEVADRLRAESGFELDASHVALSGLCADCARDNSDHAGSPHDRDRTTRD